MSLISNHQPHSERSHLGSRFTGRSSSHFTSRRPCLVIGCSRASLQSWERSLLEKSVKTELRTTSCGRTSGTMATAAAAAAAAATSGPTTSAGVPVTTKLTDDHEVCVSRAKHPLVPLELRKAVHLILMRTLVAPASCHSTRRPRRGSFVCTSCAILSLLDV